MPATARRTSCQPEPVLLPPETASVGGGVICGVPVSARTLPDGDDTGWLALALGEALALSLGEALGLVLGEALGLSLGLALGGVESLGDGLALGGMDSDWTGCEGSWDGLALGGSLGGVEGDSLGLALGGTDSLATGCDGDELGSWQADPPFEYEIRPVGVTTLG